MSVRAIGITQPLLVNPKTNLEFTPEDLIVYTARVSSPENQANTETGEKLLAYLIRHKHWSPFEQVDLTLEIETSRAVAAQLRAHRSFTFQEFSQRYAEVGQSDHVLYEARSQDRKNRQASHDDLSRNLKEYFLETQRNVWEYCYQYYKEAIDNGVAKECARILLPMGTSSRMYMKGSVRSWIHYFEVRCSEETQKEHRDIADQARVVFKDLFPVISRAVWGDT